MYAFLQRAEINWLTPLSPDVRYANPEYKNGTELRVYVHRRRYNSGHTSATHDKKIKINITGELANQTYRGIRLFLGSIVDSGYYIYAPPPSYMNSNINITIEHARPMLSLRSQF